MLKKGLITRDEHLDFTKQIIEEENLPWEEGSKAEDFFSALFGGVSGIRINIGRMGSGALSEEIEEMLFGPHRNRRKKNAKEEQREERTGAYMKICPSCGLHAWIVLADGTRSDDDIVTKDDGLECIAKLKEEGKITEEEFTTLTAEITNSDLFDDSMEALFSLHPLGGLLSKLKKALYQTENIAEYDRTPTEKPTLRFNKDKTGARIFIGKKHTAEFDNREDGLQKLQICKDRGALRTEAEYESMKQEIEACELPATPADVREKEEVVN